MVVETMLDEYYERYRHLSHEELFRSLEVGSPTQVDSVVAAWRTVEDTVGSIASVLRADLTRLRWNSPGSREFRYRLGLVAAFAQKLADEAGAIRGGLAVMSGALAQAKRRAEPDDPARPDARPVAGVLGPEFGHLVAPEEHAKARERIVMVVARLAAEYGVAEHRSWPERIPLPPPDLPGGTGGTGATDATGVVEPPPDDDPASVTPTGLAGAGDMAAAAATPVALSAGSSSPVAGPPVTLAGAGTGVVGVARNSVGPSAPGEARSGQPVAAGQASGAGAGAGMMPMLGGGHAGRASDGYAISDPRLSEDATGWSSADHMVWADGASSPPAVIGHRGADESRG